MRKFFIILTGTLFTFLFTACKQFTADIDDYLSYWSAEAFVTGHNIGSAHRADGAGVQCVSSSADTLITLTAHNPKNLTLSNPAGIVEFKGLSAQPAAGTDYELKQTGSGTLELTYKAAFLQKYGQGSADLNPTITLKAQDGRVFKQTYTFGIKSNSPPPKPKVVFAKTNRPPYHYVLCLKFNPDEMRRTVTAGSVTVPAHKDIAGITINNNSYALSYKDDNSDFKKPDAPFIEFGEVAQLSDTDSPPPPGAWVLYFKTDVGVENVGEATLHTITLRDKAGVVSDSVTAELKEKFKVEFNTQGGSPVPPDQYIEIGGLAAEPPPPAKEGYTFGGWYKDPACSNGQEWDFGNHTVTQNIILYAKWNVKSGIPYKVEHYKEELDGSYLKSDTDTGLTGTTEAELSVGNGITLRDYQGFRYDNRLEPASPKISGDGHTVVKVYYKRKPYTVNFSVDGSNGRIEVTDVTGGTDAPPTESSITVKFGGSVTFTARPDPGWEVDSWTGVTTTPPNNTTATLSNITDDKTVTVKFKAGVFNFTNPLPPDAWKKLREEAEKPAGAHTITIYYANINAPPDEREITPGRDLTIKGVGVSLLNANGHTRIFKVKDGKKLTLENIALMAGQADKGGAVYNEGTLIMKGNVSISPSEGGAGKNDVYLKKGKTITLDDGFSPQGNKAVARITLEEYRENAQVLTGSTVSTHYNRFTVTPENGTDIPWYINNSGKLATDEIEVKNENELEAAINGATPGRPRLIKVTSSFSSKKSFIIAGGKIITIKANGIPRTITCEKVTTNLHKHFYVKSGSKLTFSGNIRLQGDNYGHNQYALCMEGGTAEIKDDVTITGFSMNPSGYTYAGVHINGGILIMSGGTIKNGTAKHGGGVYIESGATFTMKGGTITGNTAGSNGHAIWIRGTFNWEGGTITGHPSSGDVLYDNGGTINNPNGYLAN